jgi:hypothetical protein
MARTISAELEAAQIANSGIPHIKLVFKSSDEGTTYDYTSRLLSLEHHEEAYNDWARLTLQNDDNGVEQLLGYHVQIGYGYYTGETVAEPHGDGAGNEYEYTARLWVKSYMPYRAEGSKVVLLELGGIWQLLRELFLFKGTAPFWDEGYAGYSVYDILEDILETQIGDELGLSIDLTALGAADDGIIDTYEPDFSINESPFERAHTIIYNLMQMTLCYLRTEADLVFTVVYPSDSDSAVESYSNATAPFFFEYTESYNLQIPNSIVVYANYLEGDLISGTAGGTSDEIGEYVETREPIRAPEITTQADADNRAAAILARSMMENLSGRLIIKHDIQLELYDKIEIVEAL